MNYELMITRQGDRLDAIQGKLEDMQAVIDALKPLAALMSPTERIVEKVVAVPVNCVNRYDTETGSQKCKPLTNAANEVKYERLLFASGAMLNTPCFKCGYNGPNYFQPSHHACAALHHDLYKEET